MKKIIFFILSALLIFSCAVTEPEPAPKEDNKVIPPVVDPLREGVVAEYLMGANSFDTSDNDNHGLLNGPVPTLNRFGHTRSAYLFNGSDSSIVIKNHPTLHSDRAITISGWAIFYENNGPFLNIFNKNNSPQDSLNLSHREYGLWVTNTGGLNFHSTPQGSAVSTNCITGSSVVTAGKWFHFVCIIDSDSNRMAIYVDGTLVKEVTYDAEKRNIRTSDGPLVLGLSGGGDGDHPFNGKLDDFRIHNRALRESEIQALYKAE